MRQQTTVDKKLVAMFTENTGSHFLDSGGAYGRNWERNQKFGVDVKQWNSRPEIQLSGDSESLDITIDAYQWLRRVLWYDSDCAKLNAKFKRWAARKDQQSESWPSTIESFCESDGLTATGDYNTYNGDCLLSQTLQYWTVEDKDGNNQFVILQVHGGCDVRGGYSTPVIFKTDDGGLYNYNSLYCHVAPKIQYDPAQTELIDGLPRDNGRDIYTDDGYHWYDRDHGGKVEGEFALNEETGKPTFNGIECEFSL